MAESSVSNAPGELRRKDSKPRVDYLDGIRGWASIAILLKHLVINLLALATPALVVSSERIANDLSQHHYLDLLFSTLLGVLANGRLGLFILFVLSGYALSVSHFNPQKNTLASAAASRYFRLMIPILYTSLFAFVLSKLGLFFNIQATAAANLDPTEWIRFAYNFSATLKDFAIFVFYDVFFKYDWYASYNIVLWTIPMQLTGSYLIYGFLAIFRRTNAVPWAMATFIAVALLNSTPVLACFILGYLIAELKTRFSQLSNRPAVEFGLIAIFLIACILSTAAHFKGDRAVCLLACSMVIAVSFSETLRSIFSARLSRFFGRISFPLYLIQIPVICSWSCYWFVKLPSLGFSNSQSIAINLLTSVAICLALSVAQLPLDKWSISASRKLGGFLLSQPDGTKAATPLAELKGLQRP